MTIFAGFPDARVGFPVPGLARHGRKACGACHLFAVQGADPGNGSDDLEGAGRRVSGSDAGLEFGINLAQLPFDQGLARDLQLFEFAHGFRYWPLWGQVQRRPSPGQCTSGWSFETSIPMLSFIIDPSAMVSDQWRPWLRLCLSSAPVVRVSVQARGQTVAPSHGLKANHERATDHTLKRSQADQAVDDPTTATVRHV